MKIRKRGQQYEISYRCQGYQNPFFERFPSVEAANFRIAQIEYEKSLGTFQPPKPAPRPGQVVTKHCITVSDLLDEYVQVYGLNRWGESYLSCRIDPVSLEKAFAECKICKSLWTDRDYL